MSKFVIEKAKFVGALERLVGLAVIKSSLSITDCVLIEAHDKNTVVLKTTNTVIFAEVSVEADEVCEEKLCIDAKLLCDFCKMETGNKVEIIPESTELVTIVCGTSKFNMVRFANTNFPTFNAVEGLDKTFDIPLETWEKLISHTFPAVSQDENRPNINSLNIKLIKEGDIKALYACGTDGYRVGVFGCSLDTNFDQTTEVNIPRDSVKLVSAVLPASSEENLKISWGKQSIRFKLPDMLVETIIKDTEFIKYENFIPKTGFVSTIKIRKDDILKACEMALTLGEKGKPVDLQISDKLLRVVMDGSTRKVIKDIEILEVEGNDISIGFNPRYLLEGLKVMDTEFVFARFTGECNPATFTPAVQGYNFLYLTLPVRIARDK